MKRIMIRCACIILLINYLAALSLSAQTQPDSPAMQEASALFGDQKWAEAAKAFEAVTKAEPANGRAWFQLGGAGYLSTAEDVARFGAALLRPGFLKTQTVEELFRPLVTSKGEETGFGLGWRIGTDKKGRRIIHQPGGGPGISCWLVLYPKEDVVVVILSNQTGAPVGGRALDVIADSFLAAKLHGDKK